MRVLAVGWSIRKRLKVLLDKGYGFWRYLKEKGSKVISEKEATSLFGKVKSTQLVKKAS
jgi:hypothetical protein